MKKQLILWSITSALALVGISSNAQAQDACDPNTFDVGCVDASIQFCNAENVTETFDCSTAGLGCGAPSCVGECPDLDNCVAANAGDPCALLLIGEEEPQIFCGAGLSCSIAVVGQELAEACIPSAGTCAAGETSAGCAGDTVLLCLGDGQTFSLADAYAVDCAIFGGGCNAGGFCEGAVGAPCDNNPNSLLKCAAGLECGVNAAGQSACQEPGAVTPDAGTPVDSGTPVGGDDAGTGNNDADAGGRDDEEEEPEPETPAGLCSNAGASTSFMGLSILGLLGALRIRRRR